MPKLTKKTHSQRIKEGIARKKKLEQEKNAKPQLTNAAGIDQAAQTLAVQAGNYDDGFKRGLAVGRARALAAILSALAESVRYDA
jgi:hypothetical protein